MTVLEVLKQSQGALLVDALQKRTGLSTGQVLGQLTLLELNGQAKSIGGRWEFVKPKSLSKPNAKSRGNALARATKPKSTAKPKKCQNPKGGVKKIEIKTVRYKDDSGRFVCSPLKRTNERTSSLPVARVGKVRTRREGAVMIAYPDAMPDAKVSYKYRKRGKTIIGVSIVALRFTGELKKNYADGIRSKDRQTRASANLFKQTISKDIQKQLESDLARELAGKDNAKASSGVIGVQDFDYPALDVADASNKEAQSLTKAVNKYRGGSIKVRKAGKSYRATGRGSMPFNDRTVNQVVPAEDIKYLAGDRSVSVLPSKRGK